MATLIDYAQKRSERIWVRSQSAVGVFEMPQVRDAIKLRGAATLPATASDFVDSEELRDTPDVDQLLKRKKPPAELSLTVYAKIPATKGRLAQWDPLARNSYGIGQQVIEILDFATLAGGTPTVTVTIDGSANVLTQGTQWSAAGSNNAAASSLASAINGLAGVSASASGAEVLVVKDDGIGEVTLASSADLSDLKLGETRYKLKSDTLESLLTIVHSTHNAGDYYRDCHVALVGVRANGNNEAEFVFSGFLGNSVSVIDSILAGSGIDSINASSEPRTSADEVTFEVDRHAFQLGPTDEDVAYCTIGTEHFKVTAYDRATKTATAFGCQFGSSPAAHTPGDKVAHYVPGADPEANDTILSMTLGAFTFASNPLRIISIEADKHENTIPRIDEFAEAALTGFKRPLTGRSVGGTLTAYQRNPDDPTGSVAVLSTFAEAEAEAVASLRLGSETGPRIVLTWPKFRLGRPEKGEQDAEFTRTFSFRGLASGTPGNDGVSMSVFS